MKGLVLYDMNVFCGLMVILMVGSGSFFGCDFVLTDIPEEQLPPVPMECTDESQRFSNALFGAYTSAEVSKMQTARIANALAKCLEKEGFTRAEAKGIIKKKEKEMQEQVEKGAGSQRIYVF